MTNLRKFRRAMTPARKKRIWERENGICRICGEPVPMTGAQVRYDHYSTIAITQDDRDEDVFPLHTASCDKPKTAADLKMIAKVKRLALKHRGEYPSSPSPLRSGNGFRRRWQG